MGSLGTRLHRDRNAMGDAATFSPRVPSTLSSRSVGMRWEDMILPSCEDPRNCVDTRNLGQSEWDQKLGKIECDFSLNDRRRWKWDDVYLRRGLPNIYSPSLRPPPLPLYLRTTAIPPWRCNWSSVFEMHLETEIEWTQRCTWRLWFSEFGDPLGGHDWASLDEYLEPVDGRRAETLFISELTRHRGNVTMWLHRWAPMVSCLIAVDHLGGKPEAEATFSSQLVIMRMMGIQPILGGCCTRS